MNPQKGLPEYDQMINTPCNLPLLERQMSQINTQRILLVKYCSIRQYE